MSTRSCGDQVYNTAKKKNPKKYAKLPHKDRNSLKKKSKYLLVGNSNSLMKSWKKNTNLFAQHSFESICKLNLRKLFFVFSF